MDLSYMVTPFAAWLSAGIAKFVINSVKTKKLAFELIGYGGLPSNHSAIVTSMVALIMLKSGISDPAFGVALTVAFIVMLDAGGLRRQVGIHAVTINRISSLSGNSGLLRERIGHSRVEIFAGIILGAIVASLVFMITKGK